MVGRLKLPFKLNYSAILWSLVLFEQGRQMLEMVKAVSECWASGARMRLSSADSSMGWLHGSASWLHSTRWLLSGIFFFVWELLRRVVMGFQKYLHVWWRKSSPLRGTGLAEWGLYSYQQTNQHHASALRKSVTKCLAQVTTSVQLEHFCRVLQELLFLFLMSNTDFSFVLFREQNIFQWTSP